MSTFRILSLALLAALSVSAVDLAHAGDADAEQALTQLEAELAFTGDLADYPAEVNLVQGVLADTQAAYGSVDPVLDAALAYVDGLVAGGDAQALAYDFYTATPELEQGILAFIGPNHFDEDGGPDSIAVFIIQAIIWVSLMVLISTPAY